jgi:pyruvate dehydrogenase kinase 2/3/4
MCELRRGEVEAQIRQMAALTATPVSLQDLFKYGSCVSEKQRRANARFLHRELPLRIAQRVHELAMLPESLAECAEVRQVRSWYVHYFNLLTAFPMPSCSEDERRFTQLCKHILQSPDAVVLALSMGIVSWRNRQSRRWRRDGGDARLDDILDRFYMARIGLRFLLEHHVSVTTDDGRGSGGTQQAGIIEQRCQPAAVAQVAAEHARQLCEMHLGDCPPITFHGHTNARITYVASHLHYMIFECLKNACRATVERCAAQGIRVDETPVKVIFAEGREDVTIKISDEGGGIARSEMGRIFSYLHSTAAPPVPGGGGGDGGGASGQGVGHMGGASAGLGPAPLAGLGVGLPLSRLYAQYFGGDLQLMSMDGYGIDAYLHIHKLGRAVEGLPSPVNDAPAERDSSLHSLHSLAGT